MMLKKIPTDQSMVLYPLSLGQILDRAVRLYRRHFFTFLGIAACIQIPLILLTFIGNSRSLRSLTDLIAFALNPEAVGALPEPISSGLSALSSLISLLTFFIAPVSSAAVIWAAGESYLGGEINVRRAYQAAWQRLGSIIGANFFFLVFGILAAIATVAVCVVGWLIGPGALIYLSLVLYPLLMVTVMLDGQHAWPALKRAWELARRRFWWMLGLSICLALFGLALRAGVQGLILAGIGLFLANQPDGLTGLTSNLDMTLLIATVTNQLLTLVVAPIILSALVVAYLDLRVRFEGLDLAWQVFENAPGGRVEALQQTPQTTGKWTPTSREWLSFFLVSLSIVGFYLVLVLVLILLSVGLTL